MSQLRRPCLYRIKSMIGLLIRLSAGVFEKERIGQSHESNLYYTIKLVHGNSL